MYRMGGGGDDDDGGGEQSTFSHLQSIVGILFTPRSTISVRKCAYEHNERHFSHDMANVHHELRAE